MKTCCVLSVVVCVLGVVSAQPTSDPSTWVPTIATSLQTSISSAASNVIAELNLPLNGSLDIVPITFSQTDQGSFCNLDDVQRDAVGHLFGVLTFGFNVFLVNASQGALSGGPAIATAVAPVATKMAYFTKDVTDLGAIHPSMGGGMGFGMSLECDGHPVFTFGGGTGGGGSPSSGNFGGGMGGQIQGMGVTFGGNGGCVCMEDGSCDNCVETSNGNGTNLLNMSDLLWNTIKTFQANGECNSLMACGTGGGGAGFSSAGPDSSMACNYGGGASVTFMAHVAGEPGQCSSSADPQNSPTAVAMQTCSTVCHPSSSKTNCFCDCFKSEIIKTGQAWALAINCGA